MTQSSLLPQPSVVDSLISILSVGLTFLAAYGLSRVCLPPRAGTIGWKDRGTFVWLVFDVLVHLVYEGSFCYLSVAGRQVNTGSGTLADMWRDYAAVDLRWGVAEPNIVAMELATVFGAGSIGCYILKLLMDQDPARHYWIMVLCTMELYGGWMTFVPEWLVGSPNLDSSRTFQFWVFIVFMNLIWVVVPLALMIDSYTQITGSLRATSGSGIKTKGD